MTQLADDDWDDVPRTHLDDDSYEEFLSREFDGRGRLRRGPSVGLWILVAIVVLVAVAVVALR